MTHIPSKIAQPNIIQRGVEGRIIKSRTFAKVLSVANFHGMKSISAQDVCWIINNAVERGVLNREIDPFFAVTVTEADFKAWARREARATRNALHTTGDGYFWNISRYR